ncbi:uncharacterized protein PHALS_08091 [Plasmopara halstedii]|uniref:Uncharacterized protein n=1 Tax=Plasmopara halstedii TaxID=4781 RepID=A0A0N7L8N6_PLAHL|nr:uncharacterized protein PHALS_08091 [Plasmopara halstedii]CEG50379.1 hypothetical protein PHALS_08091 [Plasmopara halstedii]|eukprot:XP_024586748.1 hypothetical protein PHALS_08091 [Plasmopara halstedii]
MELIATSPHGLQHMRSVTATEDRNQSFERYKAPKILSNAAKAAGVKFATSSLGVKMTPNGSKKLKNNPLEFFGDIFVRWQIGKTRRKEKMFKTTAFDIWFSAIFRAVEKNIIKFPQGSTEGNIMDKTYTVVFEILSEKLDLSDFVDQIKLVAEDPDYRVLAASQTIRILHRWIVDAVMRTSEEELNSIEAMLFHEKSLTSRWAIPVAELLKNDATNYFAIKYMSRLVGDEEVSLKIAEKLRSAILPRPEVNNFFAFYKTVAISPGNSEASARHMPEDDPLSSNEVLKNMDSVLLSFYV